MLIFLALLQLVQSHGGMVHPPIWFDAGGQVGMKSYQQCQTGNCMWFTNYTFNTNSGNAPIGEFSPLRTYYHMSYESLKYNPWFSPGSAPIFSPCGINGGNPNGCNGGKDCPGGGFGYGPDAINESYPYSKTTTWKAGSVVEAAWGIIANHGGGYSYRLCKVPNQGHAGLTEDCFQKGHLDFYGDSSWVQYGEDKQNRTEIPALRTDKGTIPFKSQWTRNPIPACIGPAGGYMDSTPDCPKGTQFDPPSPGLYGYGEIMSAPGAATFGFNIVDKLQIPSNLESGEYVLSFRWDCEQTSQVWNTCSNIFIYH